MATNSFELYRSPQTLSLLAVSGLGALFLCNVLIAFFGFGELISPSAFSIPLDEEGTMSGWYMLIGLIALLHIPIFIFTVICFLMWQYRAYKNLPALKVNNAEHTPGWAVGYWFIPILNLFRPYQVIRELWNESDPDFEPELGFLSNSFGTPAIVGWWWALWIISRIAERVSDSAGNAKNTYENGSLALVLIFAAVLSAAAAFLAIQIVRGITARQQLRFERLGNNASFLPPPPPRFV